MSEHVFRSRRDVVIHLEADHDWSVTRMGSGYPGEERESPDPLGWHSYFGEYAVSDADLLVIHRELEALRR
jgi:hypothetical protein